MCECCDVLGKKQIQCYGMVMCMFGEYMHTNAHTHIYIYILYITVT